MYLTKNAFSRNDRKHNVPVNSIVQAAKDFLT